MTADISVSLDAEIDPRFCRGENKERSDKKQGDPKKLEKRRTSCLNHPANIESQTHLRGNLKNNVSDSFYT